VSGGDVENRQVAVGWGDFAAGVDEPDEPDEPESPDDEEDEDEVDAAAAAGAASALAGAADVSEDDSFFRLSGR
jgi:hypothetical protein